ncbi:MAG: class I SAM-dependent rRNA methyltransferase [Verrucomicrobiia bacterium]|jgi:23S rRNA (cytosine1962-C5)-methyltransferase
MSSMPKSPVRVRLKQAGERAVRTGHPWVFADSIRSENRPGEVGDLATVYDRKDRFVAIGIYDPQSPIRIRILHAGKPRAIDDQFRRERIESAIAGRVGLLDAQTNGFRVINGESDGWPGLVLDRYAETAVVKIYCGHWLLHLEELTALIREQIEVDNVVLRLSRNLQEFAKERLNRADGELLVGEVEDPVVFRENGILFEAAVRAGQKTGFFLDQRDNRKEVQALSKERSVLNCFSFSGGFSLYAARGGARSVADLDISQHALDSAERNFELNREEAPIVTCERRQILGNAFDWLREDSTERFGLIVTDPPSLAKKAADREGALVAYGLLARSAVKKLDPDGILVAASCSAHVRADEFFDRVLTTVRQSGRRFRELKRTGHAPDHPASFREAEYLKCIFLEIE